MDIKSNYDILVKLFDRYIIGTILQPSEDKLKFIVDRLNSEQSKQHISKIEKTFANMLIALIDTKDYVSILAKNISNNQIVTLHHSDITKQQAAKSYNSNAKIYISPAYPSAQAKAMQAKIKQEQEALIKELNSKQAEIDRKRQEIEHKQDELEQQKQEMRKINDRVAQLQAEKQELTKKFSAGHSYSVLSDHDLQQMHDKLEAINATLSKKPKTLTKTILCKLKKSLPNIFGLITIALITYYVAIPAEKGTKITCERCDRIEQEELAQKHKEQEALRAKQAANDSIKNDSKQQPTK